MSESQLTYTLSEAAHRLRVPEPEAIRLIAAMGIRAVTPNSELRFPRQPIDQIANAQAVQTARRRAQDDAEAAASNANGRTKRDDDDPTGSNSSIFDWLPKA